MNGTENAIRTSSNGVDLGLGVEYYKTGEVGRRWVWVRASGCPRAWREGGREGGLVASVPDFLVKVPPCQTFVFSILPQKASDLYNGGESLNL